MPTRAQGYFCNLPHMRAFAVGHRSSYVGLLSQQYSYTNKQAYFSGEELLTGTVTSRISCLSCCAGGSCPR